MTRLFYPVAEDERQTWSAVMAAYREFAIDLGNYYDERLSAINPQWITDLQRDRRGPIVLNDPYFVLDEPLRYERSVVRACLPRQNDAFWAAFRTARMERNAWFHNERSSTGKNAIAAIRPIGVLSDQLCLTIESELIALYDRFTHLQAGRRFDETVDEAKLRALAARLQEEQQARESREAEVQEAYSQAQQALEARERAAEQVASMEQRLVELEAEYAAAIAGWGEATALLEVSTEQLRIEKEAEIQRILATIPPSLAQVVLPRGLTVGDPWPDEIAAGRTALMFAPAHRDFIDEDGNWLSDRVNGDQWEKFVAACADVLGSGDCEVLVDHCGHALARDYPSWGDSTYLGTMAPFWLTPPEVR